MPHDAPAAQPGKSATPLRRELFLAFGVLFGGAILVATLGLLMVLPVLRSAGETTFFIVCLLAADLSILFVFGRAVLQRSLLDPMDRLVADAGRIAGGDYEHRVRIAETRELQSLSLNMNAMADRLIREQRLLEENVRSLDGTNRELVEATDQVIRTARLASVGTLAAGIAHEIGNPLGAIMGYVDVAKKRAREGGDVTGALEATAEEARRIDRIVQSLLDYARPDRVPEGPVAIDARALVERVHSLLEAQGQLAGITVESTVDDDVPDLQGNPHHLEQILVNLFLNAVDALEGRKDRRIECRVTRELRDGRLLRARREGDPPGTNYAHRRRKPSRPPIAEESSGSYATREKIPSVVFTVRDNGPGIPDHAGDNIFDPFFTTKEPGKGTGLGLSICARLVHGMGGGIRSENAAGGGAAFSVSIPIAPRSSVAGKGDDSESMADAANEGRPAAEGDAASARDSGTRTGML